MASTYITGVFLTIYTYDGPQLVYHYYDHKYAKSLDKQVETTVEDEFHWSEEELSEDESIKSSSPISSRVSLPSSPVSPAIAINGPNKSNGPTIGSHSFTRSRSSTSGAHSVLHGSSLRSGESSLLSQGLRAGALGPQAIPTNAEDPKLEATPTSEASVSGIPVSVLSSDPEAAPPVTPAVNANAAPANAPSQSGHANSAASSINAPDHRDSDVSRRTEIGGSLGIGDMADPISKLAGGGDTASIKSSGTASSIPPGSSASQSSSQQPLSAPKQQHSGDMPAPTMPAGLDPEIIAEILTPPEIMCNEKFSLTIDDCTFVGIPVHILESGTWRPLKRSYLEQNENPKPGGEDLRSQDKSDSNLDTLTAAEDLRPEGDEDDEGFVASPETTSETSRSSPKEQAKPSEGKNSADGLNSVDESPAPGAHNSEPGKVPKSVPGVITEKDSPMRMFHVCFAILPPINEAAECEERLYHSVLVPFVRMLRQEQASKNYVWNQVSTILKTQEAVAHLSLAERQVAIESVSELAASLRKMFYAISRMDIARIMIANKPRAFQVPLQLELKHLPAWYDEVPSHSYVTTSNSTEKEITHDVYTCYGLLLLDDPEVIVEEIDVDPQGPVAAMIRNIEPTSSLDELSRHNNIEINQIVNLVWSLVYWRRARIIIPLHSRYTYGVSPLSPGGARFNQLSKAFNAIFPMMPPIHKLLGLLSTGKPKPFAVHIPTNDHRYIYMQSLAWLLQNDFIVHLPTFALIVITRKIKLAAHNYEDYIQSTAVEDDDSTAAGDSKPSNRPMKWKSRSHTYRIDIEDVHDSVILDPRTASTTEKRWLGQVMISGATRNPDQAALFQRLTKYFNGKDCLEQVMIHEKITREDMRTFLQEFSQYIITYKHW